MEKGGGGMALNDRKIQILQAIINDYIETAEPVGSRTIAKKYNLGISSATIRNEMSDLEEMGLIGSSSFASAHKKEMKNRLLVNFDCVSDGEHMLFVLRKRARNHRKAIEEAFAERDGFRVEVAEKGVFYPSDQARFPCGVGVAALRSTKGGLLYMNRIHTRRDVIYREENIEFLKDGAIKLVKMLSE